MSANNICSYLTAMDPKENKRDLLMGTGVPLLCVGTGKSGR